MSNEEMNKENVDMAELSDDELEQVSGGDGVLRRAKQVCYICMKCKKRAFFRKDWCTGPVVAIHIGCSSLPLRPANENDTGPFYQLDLKYVQVLDGYIGPTDC